MHRRRMFMMKSGHLQLNAAKTEFGWCASCRRQHRTSSTSLFLGDDCIKPVSWVRDRGIYVDLYTSVKTRTNYILLLQLIAKDYKHLTISQQTRPVLLSLMMSLALTRLDYVSVNVADVSG